MDAILRWQVKESLLAYMRRDAGFRVEAEGGARLDGDVVEIPGEVDGAGRFVASGAIVLSAHGGSLALALRDVVIDDGVLTIRDPLEDTDPGVDAAAGRMRLATLSPHAGSSTSFDAQLAGEADVLFLYNYVPGTPFGVVVISALGDAESDARISRS